MRTDPILTDTQLYYDLALTNLGPPLEGLPGVDYKKMFASQWQKCKLCVFMFASRMKPASLSHMMAVCTHITTVASCGPTSITMTSSRQKHCGHTTVSRFMHSSHNNTTALSRMHLDTAEAK